MWRQLIGLSAGLLILGACQPESGIESGPVVATGVADIGGPFTLVNQDNETVTEADFVGKPQLIYFGFTYCPDVCPLALQKMGMVQSQIDPDGETFNYIFISVDPERDTPEALNSYVKANGFPKGLVGLTGTVEQIDSAKTAFKVYAAKFEDPNSSAEYMVDHSDLVLLMDENGKFAEVFTSSTTPSEMTTRLKAFLKARR